MNFKGIFDVILSSHVLTSVRYVEPSAEDALSFCSEVQLGFPVKSNLMSGQIIKVTGKYNFLLGVVRWTFMTF